MTDGDPRSAERDFHAGRISGTEWRDILLARDPDLLTMSEFKRGARPAVGVLPEPPLTYDRLDQIRSWKQ